MIKSIIIAVFITLGAAMCCSCDICRSASLPSQAFELVEEGKCAFERYVPNDKCTHDVIRWEGVVEKKSRPGTPSVPFRAKNGKNKGKRVYCVKKN